MTAITARVEALELWQKETNSNIAAIQTIIQALESKDYVTSVTPLADGTGYVITFSQSGTITVYHGKNGADGYTPQISIKKDTDGIYYWTLDGEWMVDNNGKKIPTTGEKGENGTNGVDGITPQLKIENGYWHVSYDNGTTWEQLDKATGANGANGITPQLKIENGYWYISYDSGTTWKQLEKAVGANGQSGADGITPQLKIEEDYWYISYDNGTNWTKLGKATGEDGADGANGRPGASGSNGDSMFATDGVVINNDKTSVTFTLNTTPAQTFTLPMVATSVIYFDDNGNGERDDDPSAILEISEVKTIPLIIIGNYTAITAEIKPENDDYAILTKAAGDKWKAELVKNDNKVSVEVTPQTVADGAKATLTATLIDENGVNHSISKVVKYVIPGVSLSENGTANCYIVSAAGEYKIKAVKGNSDESVGTVGSVEVLWASYGTKKAPSSTADLISDVSHHYGGTISFTVPAGAITNEGNALIAAKDAGGTILWSWHIWLTDQPADQEYNNNAGIMMDRNLGATSATKGNVGALGLLYQWGRKDPFLGSSSITNRNNKAKSILAKDEEWTFKSNIDYGTIDYAVAHPTYFIANDLEGNEQDRHYDWLNPNSPNYDINKNGRWQSTKTIYDPCPPGYRVPDGGKVSDGGVWAKAFGIDSNFDEDAFDDTNKGFDFGGTKDDTKYLSSTSCWYPAAAQLSSDKGSLCEGGGYWSCTHDPDYDGFAYGLSLNKNGKVNPSANYTCAYGKSVRCMKE